MAVVNQNNVSTDIEINNTMFNSDWDNFDRVIYDFEKSDDNYYKACVENNIFKTDSVTVKNVIADTYNIDKSISYIAYDNYGFNLSRLSRFCTVVHLNNDNDFIHKKENNNFICIFNIKQTDINSHCKVIINDSHKLKCVNIPYKKYIVIEPQSFIHICGNNTYIAIIVYEKCNNLFLPLISNVDKNFVYISRYNRIYDELPNNSWFKFYIKFSCSYNTSVYAIMDGSVVNAIATKSTHCEISKLIYKKNIDNVTDCCYCCNTQELSKELYKKSLSNCVSSHYKSGLLINVNNIGNFTASYVGKCPNFEYVNIVMSIIDFMINDTSMFCGQSFHSVYLYGISSK
ncbi:hypothetical protein EPTV-WA-152 [Eptesipox virus]|uniref:Protein OPG181 n=1 Tax=Eptesipox virus TaxID=1329402 RepID=A0A220T6L9_9POXV|nr:hypothetical protein CG743_gp152 [Eptesipox virus]ASK51353.1 hypothetical protein EPTV-WA-152 [Eptesipox virus]WAH71111.1 hypothetical protein CG743_gp152 [Eptesipox virus]